MAPHAPLRPPGCPGPVRPGNPCLPHPAPRRQLAYHFSNGPWRLCYIKYGYDPRDSFDARIYQVIDLRLPPEFEKLVPKTEDGSSELNWCTSSK